MFKEDQVIKTSNSKEELVDPNTVSKDSKDPESTEVKHGHLLSTFNDLDT